MSDFALINPVNDVETVLDIIVADQSFIDSLTGYDYKLDVSLYAPQPGIGYTYDPGTDTFTQPPVDYDGEFVATVQQLVTDLVAVFDSRALSNLDNLSANLNNIDTSELSSNLVSTLWPEIIDYLTNNEE